MESSEAVLITSSNLSMLTRIDSTCLSLILTTGSLSLTTILSDLFRTGAGNSDLTLTS
jgi:hypothetical protein